MKRERVYPEQKKVFVRPDGQPIKSFREGWDAACRRAGLEGRLFHDLRRTAVRNMELAGISRKVAMLICGHRTESVYARYRIVAESDLSAATASMVDYYKKESGKIDDYSKTVTNTVTIED
jgi:integrase